MGNKLSNALFTLISLVLAITVFGAALGWLVPINMLIEVMEQGDVRLALAAGSIFIVILALYNIHSLFKKKTVAKFTMVDTTDLGEIHITLDAIENFISRAAASIKEVKEVKPKIKMLPEGVAMLLKIVISPDTNVPQVTKDIQNRVAQYLKEYGGMEVLEIEVVVDKIAQPTKSRVD